MTLDIKSLDKLKIKKVKEFYKIYFDYDGKHYMLLNQYEDYETSASLYERTFDENGKVTLRFITSNLVFKWPIKYHQRKVYADIDLDYFVKCITWSGFCTSMYSSQINEIREHNRNIQEFAEKLNKECSQNVRNFFK